jgi:hypothetical protein
MKLKMLTSMAGTDFTLNQGDETERFDGEEAASVIAAGYAIPVAAPTTERAVKATPAKETRGNVVSG